MHPLSSASHKQHHILIHAGSVHTICILSNYIIRAGQDHTYKVHIRYFWQRFHQIYGRMQRIYKRFWPILNFTFKYLTQLLMLLLGAILQT